MLKKLIFILIFSFGKLSWGGWMPANFKNTAELDSWFSENYATHNRREDAAKDIKIITVYAATGSGIVRNDVFIYTCGYSINCELLGLQRGIDSSMIKDSPKIKIKNGFLIINQSDLLIIRVKI